MAGVPTKHMQQILNTMNPSQPVYMKLHNNPRMKSDMWALVAVKLNVSTGTIRELYEVMSPQDLIERYVEFTSFILWIHLDASIVTDEWKSRREDAAKDGYLLLCPNLVVVQRLDNVDELLRQCSQYTKWFDQEKFPMDPERPNTVTVHYP